MLHRNTSTLGQQTYSSAFTGQEFFLADHQVNGQAVLPAVAYLEMARAALADALPEAAGAMQLELRHVVWSQPIVVTQARSISVAVFAEQGDQIGFEVYSQEGSAEVTHCQGSCVLLDQAAPVTLDLDGLRARMDRGAMPGAALYPLFAAKGLNYGPAFQAITALHRGQDQVLVDLKLPAAARKGGFVLQPSMMDCALQGSIALIDDLLRGSGKSSLPFAVEAVRVMGFCTEQMAAWVKFSHGRPNASAGLIKIDIDLCNMDGTVCVQMRGFSSRPIENVGSFDEAHYHSIIAGLVSKELTVDQAVQIGIV